MRILIIGEYSSFSENLRKGFQRIGHYCYVFSWGDVFKEIPFEANTYLINVGNFRIKKWSIKLSHLIRSIISAFQLNRIVKRMSSYEKYDVVLIINPAFLKTNNNPFVPRFSKEMIFNLVENPNNIYLSGCGNDYIYNSCLPYYKKTNEFSLLYYYDKAERLKKPFENCMSFIKKVIPFSYDYALPYRIKQKAYSYSICKCIHLPYDTDTTPFCNKVDGKIKILHGITRPHEKGSIIIKAAMDKLKDNYPNQVELIYVKHVTLTQYLKIMDEANIVVDQCYGYSYGMNAVEALAKGKVVLSGNEPENQDEMEMSDIPVINITPNVKQIYLALEDLVLNRDKIESLSVRSRQYAENIHDCKKVAQQYIETFLKHNQ